MLKQAWTCHILATQALWISKCEIVLSQYYPTKVKFTKIWFGLTKTCSAPTSSYQRTAWLVSRGGRGRKARWSQRSLHSQPFCYLNQSDVVIPTGLFIFWVNNHVLHIHVLTLICDQVAGSQPYNYWRSPL